MNAVTHFDFKSRSVRIVLDDNQEPWFCLTDVCKALDISRSSDLLQIQRGDVKNETPKRNGALDFKGCGGLPHPYQWRYSKTQIY